MINNFQKSLELVLKSEGGFSTDTTDNGNKLPDGRSGSTNYGVTQANWEAFVGHPVTHADMKALTLEQVGKFYKMKYWNAAYCDVLPIGVDYAIFDFGVNAGTGRSVKTLQQAIGCLPDGIIGSRTMAEISDTEPYFLLKKFSEAKLAFYEDLVHRKPDQNKYLRGWINRINDVESNAIIMIKA